MLLTIAIISGIAYFFSLINFANNKDGDALIFGAIFVLSVWVSCLPLAIIAMVLLPIAYILRKMV